MRVELLCFPRCPHWRVAAERLAAVAAERGFEVEHRLIDTPEEGAAGFRGSPTILIDVHDAFAAGDAPTGLPCRIYETPAGRPVRPTLGQLRGLLDTSA